MMTSEEERLAREILRANFAEIKLATYRPTDEECIMLVRHKDDDFDLPSFKHVAGFLMLNLCMS